MICSFINLDTSPERRQWMQSQFSAIGLSAERVRAVMVDEIRDHESEVTISRLMGRNWFDGEVACFLSHRECWKRISDGEDEFGAVFEDDVHFASDATDFLKDSSWIPAGVDIVKLETVLSKTWVSRSHTNVNDHKLRKLQGIHLGAAAYILRKGAAKRLLERSKLVDVPVDHLIFDSQKHGLAFSTWQLCDAICIQDNCLNPKTATMPTQIDDACRSLRDNEKPKTVTAKISRELTRPFKQAAEYLKNPIRLITARRETIKYSPTNSKL